MLQVLKIEAESTLLKRSACASKVYQETPSIQNVDKK